MRAGQFMRPGRHNKPLLWDGCKCGVGGAVGTSHKILTGIYTGIYTAPNRNKPPPERPETNNPKPPKFSGQLLRIRDQKEHVPSGHTQMAIVDEAENLYSDIGNPRPSGRGGSHAPVVCLTRWGARRVAARNTLNNQPTNQPTN